ncbi:uncharacterized protein PFL1_01920 [Pseudozyma flocculosa PF-1]|uniref:Uncharacterized protein n=1 Tax=Pseudozyma flocculosa TaxID=84751 RepID=A0A5C3EZ25_9BASI|nr:uncharacterized protein PFL1_01920 [Pseudozyma flocculosa PF-1]EPQ30394.1 hypothetical protein PFL1_01920 [Pseudozyma flocculosa PF-1]SPO37468.1 uncharacterized protein PSFLO_02942 [Pseudozyma flocculosa]
MAAILACLLFVTGAAAEQQERSFEDLSDDDLMARALMGSLDSDALLALDKRQIAAGGGSGVLTTYTGVQTISGYQPPATRPIPTPTPSGGTIISPSDIPGYGSQSSDGGSPGGSSSGATSHGPAGWLSLPALFTTAFAAAMAAGAGWAFL